MGRLYQHCSLVPYPRQVASAEPHATATVAAAARRMEDTACPEGRVELAVAETVAKGVWPHHVNADDCLVHHEASDVAPRTMPLIAFSIYCGVHCGLRCGI